MKNRNSSRLGNNIVYQLIYQLVTVLTPLVVTPYLSRTLGATEIGKYSYAYSIAYYFVLAAGLGITAHGSRRIAAAKDDADKLKKTFSSLFWVHFAISIVVLLVYVAAVSFGMNKENSTLSLIMTFYVLSAVVDVKWFFYGMENFRVTVLRSIIIKILYVILIFVFVNTSADTGRYTFIMAFVSFFLAEASLFVILPRYIKLAKPNFADIKKEIVPLFILFIPSVANLLLRHFDKIMLGWLSTYEQLGLYENTDKVFLILTTAITSTSDVILPRMSNLIAKGDDNSATKIFNTALRLSIILACAFCFGMIAIAGEFVPIFFGSGFEGCIKLLSWISPSIILVAFSVTIRKQYLIPHFKEKVYTTATVTSLIVNIVANAIFIPQYGAIGAVYGTLIAEFSVVFIQFLMIRKELDYWIYIKELIKYSFIGLIMLAIVRVIAMLPIYGITALILEIIAGAFTYILLTFGVMLITHDDLLVTLREYTRNHKRG